MHADFGTISQNEAGEIDYLCKAKRAPQNPLEPDSAHVCVCCLDFIFRIRTGCVGPTSYSGVVSGTGSF